MNTKIGLALSAVLLLSSSQIFATSYTVPPPNRSLIGQVTYGAVGGGETTTSLAKRYDLGHNAMISANPHLDRNNSGAVKIPSQHLLPSQARQGIVINLPEMRMYYYPPGSNVVLTYPIGIGKIGKTIPIKNAVITRKTENPTWVPPDDIREFNLQQGIVLPQVMPPGPDNPLGPYAIYMSIPTYLIHSTIFPESIGKRASFGCIRMYESDIQEFFPSIQGGISVAIINSPVKVGWQDDRLYMEAHEALEEHSDAPDASLPGMVQMISNKASDQPVLVDWQMVSYLARERDGLPHEIGVRIPRN
ncbi:MAG: L,D-transpeptidase family protein [Gammaproteobacteria bacterium]|nr:L,D-transpeptidase family protein [Gammaproteobacteria bacterium]